MVNSQKSNSTMLSCSRLLLRYQYFKLVSMARVYLVLLILLIYRILYYRYFILFGYVRLKSTLINSTDYWFKTVNGSKDYYCVSTTGFTMLDFQVVQCLRLPFYLIWRCHGNKKLYKWRQLLWNFRCVCLGLAQIFSWSHLHMTLSTS